VLAFLSVLHRTIDASNKRRRKTHVTSFENATGMMLAIAAQALAIGLLLTL
jgi:hypothetical protein